jgi:hypothetical protein
VWSEERPRPYKITDKHFSSFYYLNTFVCHKSIARRLAKFYVESEPLFETWRALPHVQSAKPHTWASMLERTTGMYFCMLLASEEGRDLRVEQIPIVYHDFGS